MVLVHYNEAVSPLVGPQDWYLGFIDMDSMELPQKRFTLTRNDERKTVHFSAGDYKVLSYMADREEKTKTAMAHELFTMGLRCKLHRHEQMMVRLGQKRR